MESSGGAAVIRTSFWHGIDRTSAQPLRAAKVRNRSSAADNSCEVAEPEMAKWAFLWTLLHGIAIAGLEGAHPRRRTSSGERTAPPGDTRRSPMDGSVEAPRTESQKPLTKWVDEMRDVIKVITDLSEESARHRAVTESAQREYTKVCEEVARLRTETEQANGLAAAAQQERDALREEVGRLHAENDQLQLERAEAEEAAAKLLDEMKELVTDAVQKLQGPPRTSPFAREARLSHSRFRRKAHDS